MKTIWKFPIKVTDQQVLQVPQDAQLLSVQMQGDQPCIWALVDPEAQKRPCTVQVFGTGHPVASEGAFLGTFQMHGGSLVFHVFFK